MIINKALAKRLSKRLEGNFGLFTHWFVVAIVYQLIGSVIYQLLGSLPLVKINHSDRLWIWYFFAGICPIIGTFSVRKMYAGKESKYRTFGRARFAEGNEVIQAGLHGAGIVFGRMGKALITKPPQIEGHTLVVGGTGTGKSRGVVIPSLLAWPGSALVIDIKGELSHITSTRRRQYGRVYIFDPEGNGDCYDPILACTDVANAQELARTLIPLPHNSEPFWAQAAQAILAAAVFDGAINGSTLADCAEKLCTTPINDLVDYFRNHSRTEVKLLASIAYDLPERTLGGVIGELKSRLITIATDPNIRRATSRSDWSPAVLETGATVYLKVSEHLLNQYKSLWTVIISQVLRYWSHREERKEPPILLVLDEMPRLARINGLTNALATLRSRNVHILTVIQSMAQLDSIYGQDNRKVIADNCRFKFVLSATDPETQKYFSDLAGQQTVLSQSTSSSAAHLLMPSHGKQEVGTPLIRPEEWANLTSPILLAPKLQPAQIALAYWDKEKDAPKLEVTA